MFLHLILLTIAAALTLWAWTHRTELKLSWQLPGLFPYVPFVGILWRFFIQEILEALDTYAKKHETTEEPIGLWVGPRFVILVDNVRDIETLLTSPNCARDDAYQYIKDVAGFHGLFTLENDIARKHRRLASPSFSDKVVLTYVTTFAQQSSQLVDYLRQKVNKEPFDIRQCISDCTLDAFTAAIYGTEGFNAREREIFHRNMKLGQSLVGKRCFLPWFQSDLIWKLSGNLKMQQMVTKSTSDIIDKAVQQVEDRGRTGITFLDRMMRVSEEMNDFDLMDVKGEAINTFIAGTDTSSAAIAYTVLLLAMHPQHQERVFEELKTVLPSKDTLICPEHIHQLPYLELCIKESLRLFPIVSLMSKKVKNGTIKLGKYEIGPGTSIVIGVSRIHRKIKYWGSDANQFNPTRFLPENISKVNRFAYIPFSEGARNCVGYKYAYVVMKTILANILRNFRLTTPLKLEELRVRIRVNIFLLNKHMVQIHERNE